MFDAGRADAEQGRLAQRADEREQQRQRDRDDEQVILERNIYARLKSMILGKTAVKGPKGIKAGAVIDERYNGGGSAADYIIDDGGSQDVVDVNPSPAVSSPSLAPPLSP